MGPNNRPPDDRRYGFGSGRLRPPPVGGFAGITPEKMLKLCIAKMHFRSIINGFCSAILHKKLAVNDCLTPASQLS